MRKIGMILIMLLIVTLLFLDYSKSYNEVKHLNIDEELSFEFSMKDIEKFNSFILGKDMSIKVKLTYNNETHEVKLINTSSDKRLAFRLYLGNNFTLLHRQIYELSSLVDEERHSFLNFKSATRKEGIFDADLSLVKVFINGIDYGVFMIKQYNDEDFAKEMESGRLKESTAEDNDFNILETFTIGSTEGRIDHKSKVIFVSLEKGSDTLQMITYRFSNYQTDIYIGSSLEDEELEWIKIEEGKAYDFHNFIYWGKLSYNSFNNRVVYNLYITTGDVQIIEISTENEIGEVVQIDISEKIPCQIRVLSNKDEEYANKIIKGKIEVSGKTLNEKKSYSIKMDKKYELNGMSAAKDWILDGNILDISLMRKKLTYDVLRQIYESDDIKISIPEVRYVEVILNGQYQGLYTLSHKIDEDLLNLDNFKSYKTDNDLLYKCVNVNGKFISKNMDRSIYSKDYKDFPNGLQPENKDLDPIYGWHSGYEQKWPDTEKYGQYWEPLEQLIRTIALSSDEEFNNIFSTVDREKIINLWVLLLTQNNLNGVDNGQYVIKDGKWFFIPWETNQVFGIDKEMNKVRYDTLPLDYLFNRCMEIDSFNKDFVDKWELLVDRGIITVENLHNLIEIYFGEIEDSQKRNYERWPISGEVNFHDEVEYMKSWIENRINWLDLYLHGEWTYEE